MDTKRRLPLIASAHPEEPEAPRPGWQWVGFGTLAIFAVWLPLAAVAGWVATTTRGSDPVPGMGTAMRSAIVFAAASAIALALASLAGGYLIGRWGGRGVGVREATWAGLSASFVAIAASWMTFGFAPGALLVIAIASPFSAAVGKLGLRARG